MFEFNQEAYERRMAWYTQARFGMFIHWGIYAIPARGALVRETEEMTVADYERYFRAFTAEHYDPRTWARTAREAGMKYMVLTAKHHDGFCLFDSKYTDYKSTNTPCGRDLVREYLEAAWSEGLKVGLYYSLLDWHHPNYPHYKDARHPMRNHPEFAGVEKDFDKYLKYMHGQVEELVTNYGQLDILWFDFSYGDLRGEAWRATELIEMVRRHQPEIIIDNRLEVSGDGHGSLYYCDPKPYHGDFESPEQLIPPQGIRNIKGERMIWETCLTMNNTWGFNATDHYWKSAPVLIHKLVECVSKGGNMLLNVGPMADGRFPEPSVERLAIIGDWMRRNGESIYGCTGAFSLPKPDFGRITRRGNKFYVHVFENAVGPLPLIGFPQEKVISMRNLATGAAVQYTNSFRVPDYPEICFAYLGPDPKLPDEIDTVIEITMDEDWSRSVD